MQLLPVFERGERVLAALSGGADSVCLLRLLVGLRDAGEIGLCAAHLDHGIRGEEARGDRDFVEALCRDHGVPLLSERVDVPALARAGRRGLETQARETRRAFLIRAMEQLGADVIATGHHRGDQAETLLMHLLRGCGLRGAGGMRARAHPFCRPLLHVGKEEILAYLAELGQSYRRDSTNFAPDNPRNALRLRFLPGLKALYPGCEEALARFARLAEEADDYLRGQAEAFLQARQRKEPFGASIEVQPLHPALKRLALALWAGTDYRGSEGLCDLYDKEAGALVLGKNRFERWGSRLYRIEGEPAPPPPQPLADGAALPGLGRILVAPWTGGPLGDDPLVQAVDGEALAGAELRTRRPGDRIQPLGAPGTRKLSDLMIDKKVPRPLRDWVPLLARGDRVLWAVGVALSQQAAIGDNTAETFRLEWEREELPHES